MKSLSGNPFNPRFLYIGLVVFLGLIIYANSLGGRFIWDDYNLVKNNAYVKNLDLGRIFLQDIGKGSGTVYNYYRPLQIAGYAMEYLIWGLNPLGYHFINLLLHILTAVGLYQLLFLLGRNEKLSFWAAALFIVHPVNVETVSYISDRADLLVAMFILLTLISYIKSLDHAELRWKILVPVSYALALLSKENALIFPLAVLLYHYMFKIRIKFKPLLLTAVITLVYIVARLTILKQVLSGPLLNIPFYQRIPGFFAAIAGYLRMLFLPFDLHADYGNRLFYWNEPKVLLGLAAAGLLLIYVFKNRKTNRLPAFLISWFLVTLLPVSNIYPPLNFYIADHYLYLPIMGAAGAAAYFLLALYEKQGKKIAALIALGSLLISYSALTIKQNLYWLDPIFFCQRTLAYNPRNWKIQFLLACTHKEIGDNPDAAKALLKTLEINPTYAEAYNELGIIYKNMDKTDQALDAFHKALEIKPDYALVYNNLAVIYYSQGRWDLAIEHCDQALALGAQIHPGFLKIIQELRKTTGDQLGK